MLGHKLWQACNERFDTWVTIRSSYDRYEDLGLFNRSQTIDNLDVSDFSAVKAIIEKIQPDVIVNAVGIIRQIPEGKDPITCLTINSLLPHYLQQFSDNIGARLVQISTDCVFSGTKGNYLETDPVDPDDLYGHSKALGEIHTGNAITLRTSIIGRELDPRPGAGLIEWFLSNQNGNIKGFTKAIYTGFPTVVLSDIICEVIEKHPNLQGLHHVSSTPISKYDLLCTVRDAMDLPIRIEPFEGVSVDASLNSDRFRKATGYSPPSWPALVQSMTEDITPYDEWRKLSVSG